MADAHSIATLDGNFKQVYADKIKDLYADSVKLLPRVKFVSREKQPGNAYNAPVILGSEHGISYATEDEGAFALNAPITGQTKNASVKGTQMVLRSAISYGAAFRAQGSTRAFEDATKLTVKMMVDSITRDIERQLINGQMGMGAIASVSSPSITIATADWAPGIYVGGENMPLEIRDVTGATLRGYASIVKVDMSTRTLELDALPGGTVATDVVWKKGSYGKEMAGLHKIISNTGSIFGINSADYSLWQGNVYAASGTLSFAELSDALARAVEKGLQSKVLALVNPRTWVDLLDELVAKRQFDSSYKAEMGESGHEALVFHSQNGKIEVLSSTFVKEGFAFLVSEDDLLRVGATDVTFKRPHSKDGSEFFKELENNAGFELRCYSNQALFCEAIGRQTMITGIVN